MSAQVTEAHRKLACDVLLDHSVSGAATKDGVISAAQLIADSEARATERLRREIDWLQLNNDMLTDNPVGHARAVAERQAIIDERDELRAALDNLCGVKDRAVQFAVENKAEADELRAEVERLKADGAASAFINMSCRASRAETDRNNIRADLDAIKAILTEEKARAERAEAELKEWSRLTIWGGTPGFIHAFVKRQQARIHAAQDIEAELAAERARLDWLEKRGPWESWNGFMEIGITLRENIRAAIDAAMKEGAK